MLKDTSSQTDFSHFLHIIGPGPSLKETTSFRAWPLHAGGEESGSHPCALLVCGCIVFPFWPVGWAHHLAVSGLSMSPPGTHQACVTGLVCHLTGNVNLFSFAFLLPMRTPILLVFGKCGFMNYRGHRFLIASDIHWGNSMIL